MSYKGNINAVKSDATFEEHLKYLAELKTRREDEYAKAAIRSYLEATDPETVHDNEYSWNRIGGRLGSRSNWKDQR